MVLYEGIAPCRCGGIGRRTGLKIPRRKSYGFDPRHRYHVRRSKHRSVSALRRKLHYVSSFFLLNCDPLRWARSLVWKRFFQIEPASLGFDLVPVKSKHRSVSASRRKLHYVSSFFLTNSSLWETGSDYLLYPLSAQPKPGAAVRARECRKFFFRTMQRCFFRTTALLEIEGGQTLLVSARLYGF